MTDAALVARLFGQSIQDRIINEAFGRNAIWMKLYDLKIIKILAQSLDLDRIILAQHGQWGNIRVANVNGLDEQYISEQVLTPDFIRYLYQHGYTVVLNDLQRESYPVFTLCQELSTMFVGGVNCNAYMTPRSSRALHKHYDDEDVIIVQITGSKNWSVYSPPSINAGSGPGYPYSEAYIEQCELSFERILQPGDALYIPKGFPHEAWATMEDSVHLTFSIATVDVKDFLTALLDELHDQQHDVANVRNRISIRGLSAGKLSIEDGDVIQSAIASMLDLSKNGATMEKALGRLTRKQCASMDGLLLQQARLPSDRPDLETILTPNPLQLLAINKRQGKAYFKGGDIDVSKESMAILQKVHAGVAFKVSELPGQDIDEKIELACGLLDNGIVRIME